MARRGQTINFVIKDKETDVERKERIIKQKKEELDWEFNPEALNVPSTQACLPPEYSNNPYIKFGSKHYFSDEDVNYDKE